jgi:hypothetical protein
MRVLVAPKGAPNLAITTLSRRAGTTSSPTRESLADLGGVTGHEKTIFDNIPKEEFHWGDVW